MPEALILDTELEGKDNEPETIGMDEMLYASQSTLENAEDGTILREEYHLKLVTESGFRCQVGCLTDVTVTLDDTVILMETLRETFEAVEMGTINEGEYFFELMSPYFYYTSGSYRTSEQVQTTVLALSRTSSSESEESSLLENNVYTLLASNASYNPKILPFLDFDQAPTYPKKGIREKRSVGGNSLCISMIQLFIVVCARIMIVGALPVNTEPDSPLTLTVGSDGVIPFACRNEQQSATKYYTVKFEEKDRPFYIDGTFDPEGLMSPDQAERFRVEYFEEGSSMSVEINIASVSVEDQGTYIVLLIIQGETPEHHLMKRVVLIFIPPGPAVCFLIPSEIVKTYEVHCHSKPGNGNSTLTCFQNGNKIPYQKDGGNTQVVYRRTFWLMDIDIPVSCCSHYIKEIPTITQTSCNQYKYPRIEPANSPVPPVHEIPTKLTLTTRPLSMEEKHNQPFPETISYSGCGRNVDWSTVMLPLMALFTYLCISNP